MKTLILLVALFISCPIHLYAEDDDPILSSKKMGLTAYLTTVKGMAEMKSLSLQNQTALYIKEIDRQIAEKPSREALDILIKVSKIV